MERFAEISSKYSLSVFFCCYCSVTKDLKGCLGCEQGTLCTADSDISDVKSNVQDCVREIRKQQYKRLKQFFFFQITQIIWIENIMYDDPLKKLTGAV